MFHEPSVGRHAVGHQQVVAVQQHAAPPGAASLRRVAGRCTVISWVPLQTPSIAMRPWHRSTRATAGFSIRAVPVPMPDDGCAPWPWSLPGLSELMCRPPSISRRVTFHWPAGTGNGALAVDCQVDLRSLLAARDGEASDVGRSPCPVLAAAPPGLLAEALEGHRLAVDLVQQAMAGTAVGKLLVDEVAFQDRSASSR